MFEKIKKIKDAAYKRINAPALPPVMPERATPVSRETINHGGGRHHV